MFLKADGFFGVTGLSIISFLSFGLFFLVESLMSLGSFLPVVSFVSLNHLCLLNRLCLLGAGVSWISYVYEII